MSETYGMLLWVFLPAGTLVLGFALGIALTRYGLMRGFNEHLDKHYFVLSPNRDCIFCVEERGALASPKSERGE
jgi:hypothetical protein